MTQPVLSVDAITSLIKHQIEELNLPVAPQRLYDPIRYILKLDGKRMRPLLALMSYNLFASKVEEMVAPSLAIEVFHNFSLVHDDIMDKAPIRRGQDTVHKKWDENIAILSGDAMLVKAYDLLTRAPESKLKQLMVAFNNTALAVCEGQQYDMDFELRSLTENPVSEAEYMNMIRLKTAVLIGLSLQFGGIIGAEDEITADLLYESGVHLGLAFQLQDDLLDLYGGEQFGKQMGGDILNAKKTYLLVKLLEIANDSEQEQIIEVMASNTMADSDKIAIIKRLYDQHHIADFVQSKIAVHLSDFNRAIQSIGSERAENLLDFVNSLANRGK